jgi:hypothetical protein
MGYRISRIPPEEKNMRIRKFSNLGIIRICVTVRFVYSGFSDREYECGIRYFHRIFEQYESIEFPKGTFFISFMRIVRISQFFVGF